MRIVESTDLSNESIDDIKVGMSINDKSLIIKHGNFEEHPGNEHYATQRNYDQYWNKDIIVSVDRETNEILQVSILEENNTSSTAMGIKRGSSIDEVIATYGENYYIYEDKEQTIYLIGYVDHHNDLQLSFLHFDNKVIGIDIGYALNEKVNEKLSLTF
ncbi:hypothetical protein RYX56_06580 [Alkalihalophilus lindianensis]|uniref:DUF4178 domain-containing protein n=1 Tax=Alkalihalophilus lindianensis TaxID=1630542 RepID=A0ABU3X817_9BACI|nr:hypothetical protein [Alkalihalophilus lindianensis]MDV2684036.1 hypothetical protein [Alkalihalophilus lindianensis]